MRKKLGFVLILISLISNVLITSIPSLFQIVSSGLQLLSLFNTYVLMSINILFALGIYLCLDMEKPTQRYISITILLSSVILQVFLPIWLCSRLVGFFLLWFDKRQNKLLFIVVAEGLIMVLRYLSLQIGLEHIGKLSLAIWILSVIILVSYIYNNKSKMFSVTIHKKQRLQNIRIFSAFLVLLMLLGFQSIFRTESINKSYELRLPAEHERYAKTDLNLSLKLSPLFFGYHYSQGEIAIGGDTYHLKSIEKKERLGDNNDMISFRFVAHPENNKDAIKLYLTTYGSSDEIVEDIHLSLFTNSFSIEDMSQENYSYRLKRY